MNMSNPELEPQEPLFSPVERYYMGIRRRGGSSLADQQILLDRLVEDSGILEGGEQNNAIYEYVAAINSTDNDERTVIEMMSLFPLFEMSLPIELTKPEEGIYDWYDQLSKGILQISNGYHKLDCLKYRHEIFHLGCQNSSQCPVRVLKKELLDCVNDPKFEDVSYLDDHKRAYTTTITKLHIAKKHKLIEPLESDTTGKLFVRKFNSRFAGSNEVFPSES